jgi:hypothetical protein
MSHIDAVYLSEYITIPNLHCRRRVFVPCLIHGVMVSFETNRDCWPLDMNVTDVSHLL